MIAAAIVGPVDRISPTITACYVPLKIAWIFVNTNKQKKEVRSECVRNLPFQKEIALISPPGFWGKNPRGFFRDVKKYGF